MRSSWLTSTRRSSTRRARLLPTGASRTLEALEARIRAAAKRQQADATRPLKQLERVLSIHRARGALAREPEPPPAPRAPRGVSRAADDHREHGGAPRAAREGSTLSWDTTPSIAQWEVRISGRPDARRDYAVRETLNLPADGNDVGVDARRAPSARAPPRTHPRRATRQACGDLRADARELERALAAPRQRVIGSPPRRPLASRLRRDWSARRARAGRAPTTASGPRVPR